jgi:hypothetical protein
MGNVGDVFDAAVCDGLAVQGLEKVQCGNEPARDSNLSAAAYVEPCT